MKKFEKIAFIGLGLIGGSIAKAIREARPDVCLVAYDRDAEASGKALAEGVLDQACDSMEDAVKGCDCVFLCAPVGDNRENMKALVDSIDKDCLLTDVGSVKTGIHETISELGIEAQFIGGHPMAGSERYGYDNSKASLIERAYYILTPTKSSSAELLEAYQDLVQDMKAIPLVLDYKDHDMATAAISHLPHVIAASLVNLVKNSDNEDGIMKTIAAGGFKDITRIASSSSTMWQQICLTNTENISGLLQTYIDSLVDIKEKIDKKEATNIFDFFNEARQYRDSFANFDRGPIKKSFSVSVEIPDEPGTIATVATLLSVFGISIKNIGIIHNRERAVGALSIEFYSQEEKEEAIELLTRKNYVLYNIE